MLDPSSSSSRAVSATQLFIGLDAGASKTTLLAESGDGSVDLRLDGPPANLQRSGVEQTAEVLVGLIRQAREAHPSLPVASICAGVAGAGQSADREALTRRLKEALDLPDDQSIRIVHDAAIALETAFGEGSGVILIAGTGSVVFGRTPDGRLERTGGWGYLIGDEGSGHALGIAGLRAVAHAMDSGPPTRLQALLADRHGVDDRDGLIRLVYGEDWPAQQFAPQVIEAALGGDAIAGSIVEEQAGHLAQQVRWLARRCPTLEPRIALVGGLVNERYYREALSDALQELLPDWSTCTLDAPPVTGAVHMARRLDG